MFILAAIPSKNVTVIYSKKPFTKNPYFETKTEKIPTIYSITTTRSTHTYQVTETNEAFTKTFSLNPSTVTKDKTYFPGTEKVANVTNFGIYNDSKTTDHPNKIRHRHR